ncbi:expressed unknown protein [Seminavis robusta]|uniref:Uncharacterized protein n=1 Tax=Seminavis robusta TaxID=568900 RepID=A0A9N8D9M4_9STRA|nr:expressed unknown protein [Seminavis robusta]|eukprot:Sro25_g017090.1 n/a (652) ;mRNA; f:112295-114250
MRYWSSRTALDGPSQQPPEIRFCYTFSGGHNICDGGPKGGVCPLSLNGETCSSCLTLMDLPIQEASELATQEPLGRVAPCDFPDKDYGNFFADCTNVAGGAEVDKCLNTGFAGSLLSDYAIYTDIKLANAPASVGQCSATAVTPADLGFTQAPSPAPSPMPIATLVMGEKTEPFNLTQRERRIFELSVSDVTAIFLCRVESDGNNGDVDLSVAVDVLPTDETQECASKNADSEEECWVVVSGASLSVYAEVYADTATRDIQIECFIDEDESDARDVSEEVGDDRSFDLRQNQYELFMVAAPEGTEFVACTVDSDEGEVFLWMRVGQMPIPREGYVGDDSCQDTCESGVECCFVPVSGGDVDVFVLLYGLEEVDDGDIECVVEFQAGSRPTDRDGLELDDGEEFSLSLNQQRDFYVEIPQGTLMVRCSVESDDGSVFLAFRVGQPPLLAADSANDVFDCGSSTGTSGSARCTEVWSSTIGGVSEDTRIYLAVTPDGGTQVEDATIECTATVPVDDEEAFDVDLPFQRGNIRLNEGGRSRGLLFRFDIPEGVVNVDCFATSDFGDIDFYMRVDDVPNLVGNEFDCAANFFATSEEFCSISANRFDEGDAVFVFVHNGGDTAVQGGVLECFGFDAEDLLVTTSRSGPMGNPDVP